MMKFSFAAETDVGRQREHNEDHFLIDKKLGLFVVADGMGGHAAGEVASSITVHQVREAVYNNRDLIEEFKKEDARVQAVDVLLILQHALQTACTTVYQRAQRETEKRGMGTTASVLLIAGAPGRQRGFIAHVGDSRIYLVRQNQCHQLTEDHSLMNELVRSGKITRDKIDDSPYKQYKNAVTRAVGVYASVEVDTFDFDILPGDHFLLASDGMYVYVKEEELPKLLVNGEVQVIAKALVDRANEGGGHDNITAIVVRVGDEAAKEAGERAVELSLKIELLKSMRMFRYLSYKELVRVMNITKTLTFDADERVFVEGDPGGSMFVVMAGTVEMRKGGDVVVAELGRGQHFGEMSLVDRSRRSLTAVATDPTRLLCIQRREFYEIIKKEPTLAVKLLWSFVQVFAERLRKTTEELSGALHHDVHVDDGDDRQGESDRHHLFDE